MIARPHFYLALLTAVIALLVTWCFNPFALYFQNDDFIHIPLSAHRQLMQRNSFRPVCDFSIMLDYWLWHKQAWGYHLTNLLLHIINSLVVFKVSVSVLHKYQLVNNPVSTAWCIAVLFFAYAMHSEAVFWILGRSAALGTLFFLLSIFFYLKRANGKYFITSIVFIFLSWLSYESTWILPAVILIISVVDVQLDRSELVKEWFCVLPVFCCFFIYLFLRYYFTGQLVGNYEAGFFIQGNVKVLAQNFVKLMIRSWLPPMQNWKLLIIFFVFLIAAIVLRFFSIKEKKIRTGLIVFMGIWLITLLHFSSLGIDTRGTEAERFLYLPSVFVCMIICLLAEQVSFLKLRYGILVGILCIHLAVLMNNARNYRFTGTIVRTTIEQVKALQHTPVLYITNLPLQYRGALIFRSGFREAVAWMKNEQSIDSVSILSKQTKDQAFTPNYQVDIKDSTIVSKPKRLNKGDTYWRFTDSSLQVFTQP